MQANNKLDATCVNTIRTLSMDAIRAIPGVVATGLFLEIADTVLIGNRAGFRLIEEKRREPRMWHMTSSEFDQATPKNRSAL